MSKLNDLDREITMAEHFYLEEKIQAFLAESERSFAPDTYDVDYVIMWGMAYLLSLAPNPNDLCIHLLTRQTKTK